MDPSAIPKIIHFFVGFLTVLVTKNQWLSSLLFRILMWFKRIKRDVQVKDVEYEGFKFSYFCRGKPGPQPSVLMLHGFSFNKDMWLDTIKFFPRNVHLICVDMPGHGETTRLLAESYTAEAQTQRIHQFVECVGLNKKPFHLVGMSVGGMVAGLYAAQYPSEVCSLSLLCPAGVQNPRDNEFFSRLRELLRVRDAEGSLVATLTMKEEEDLLRLGLHHDTLINVQLLKGYLNDPRPHKIFFLTYFLDVTSEESRLSLFNNMSKINVPTQIIWGKQDRVFDPPGADILAKAIPDSQLYMLEECGHFITLDQPEAAAKLLLHFYTCVYGSPERKKLT
ncbi:monoacylglycerol lipase ABHD6-like [Tiliqua scincoides]|uniref:monoacylglycerol lipase ABHD6-like n=1 Tax=Tiliqua scincoides TaxID=71010 RepID=UPI0034626DA5